MRNSSCSSFRLLVDWLCNLGVMALLPALFPPSHHMPESTCFQKQGVCQWRLCLKELGSLKRTAGALYILDSRVFYGDHMSFFFFKSFSFKTPWLCQHLPLTVQIRKFLLFPLQTHGRKKSSCAQPSSPCPAEVTTQRPVCLYPTKPIS